MMDLNKQVLEEHCAVKFWYLNVKTIKLIKTIFLFRIYIKSFVK